MFTASQPMRFSRIKSTSSKSTRFSLPLFRRISQKAFHQHASKSTLLSSELYQRRLLLSCNIHHGRNEINSRHYQTSMCLLNQIGRGGDNQIPNKHENKSNNDEVLEFVHKKYQRVYIAVGANIGDRFNNLMKGISMLENTTCDDINIKENHDLLVSKHMDDKTHEPLIRMITTSFLRETPPMYVTDQPSFLNGAIEIETKLSPHALLKRLKEVEAEIGRDLNGIRNGPRPIDFDIIYYGVTKVQREDSENRTMLHGGQIIQTNKLEVPHPRISEREFVLEPLCDLEANLLHPLTNISSKKMLDLLTNQNSDQDINNKESSQSLAVQVLPLPRNRMLSFNETHVMGILNVTPDSFSDGGNYEGSVDMAVVQALEMVKEGASIIDIGGESTRPGAKEVEASIELKRTIPVIRKLRELSDIPISIDTRHSQVAKEAIEAGADIINDVSGGTYDPLMFQTASTLNVPMIIMHMRGTPETMQSMAQYDNVVEEVSSSLMSQSKEAELSGIPRFLQVLDPGIGFAKQFEHNLSLLKDCNKIRKMVDHCPLLLGPSRKGFIGKISGEDSAENRDFGTLASCLVTLMQKDGNTFKGSGPTILRVHNVKGIKQGVKVFEAIMKAK